MKKYGWGHQKFIGLAKLISDLDLDVDLRLLLCLVENSVSKKIDKTIRYYKKE